ncbi:MAG: 30S ribosome-binding factor RbfA [bacterium]|nr:30S ribosome-binding factor RbfA [bacterium]
MAVPRVVRLNELVKRALSIIIEREFSHERLGWVTISRVIVSKDLQHARVFFTVLGDATAEQHALRKLIHARGFIRMHLARAVRLRYTPALIFELDEELKQALHVERLLDQACASLRAAPGAAPANAALDMPDIG